MSEDNQTEDSEKKAPKPEPKPEPPKPVLDDNARTVVAYIRDKCYVINIADGSQTVDWLADVVLFKYKRNQFEKMNCRGVKYHNNMLNMKDTLKNQVENGHDVYILLEGDEDVDAMFGDEI